MISFEAVQQAVYNTLIADEDLEEFVGSRILDQAEQNTPYPMVVIDSISSTPYNLHGSTMTSETAYAHLSVWSKTNSWKEADDIASLVLDLLAKKSLTQGSYGLTFIYEFAEQIRSPDGKLRHIPIRFKVLAFDP